MRRFIAALFAFTLLSAPAMATPPRFNGDVVTATMPTFNVIFYGAKGDDTTDNTTAINNAITAAIAAGGGTIYFPRGTYLVNGAIAIPWTLSSNLPVQPPLRFTGDGPNWNSYLSGSLTSGGSILDLRYTGGDGLHPAKIDTRGGGHLEIDHLTLEDGGTDDFIFMQTTNTTVYIHDNSIIGDTAESGTTDAQDFIRLGGPGYWASTVNTTNGSATLTIGGGDPPFTAGMVGWTIYYGTNADGNLATGTISAVNSSTSVTLSAAATSTITNGVADYFAIGSDANAPFQGYTSKLYHNIYSHIRRGSIWENFANGVVAEDEIFAQDTGCNNAVIANCAPYYFDKSPVNRLGNIIRAPQVEVMHYPYVVFVKDHASGNVFRDLSPDDATVTNLGTVYFGSASATANVVTLGAFVPYANNPNINTTVAGSFSSGSQTLTPASMTGITTSTKLLIDPDGSGITEWVTPSATTSTTFTATFANAHGTNIRVLGTTSAMAGPGASANNILLGNGLNIEGTVLPYQVQLGSTGQGWPVTVNTQLVIPNVTGSLPAVSDNKSVATTLGNQYSIAFGAKSSATKLFAWGIDSNASGVAIFGELKDTLAGVTGDTAEIGINGCCALLTVEHSGNVGVKNILASANGVQPHGTTGAFSPETFIGGSAIVNDPKIVTGTCAVTSPSTACAFGNSFAFVDTSYTCTLGAQGTSPVSSAYVPTSTTTLTIYSSASATFSFTCHH